VVVPPGALLWRYPNRGIVPCLSTTTPPGVTNLPPGVTDPLPGVTAPRASGPPSLVASDGHPPLRSPGGGGTHG